MKTEKYFIENRTERNFHRNAAQSSQQKTVGRLKLDFIDVQSLHRSGLLIHGRRQRMNVLL